MAQKGITKKQFWIQMVPAFAYLVLAVYWLVSGLQKGRSFEWIIGLVLLVLTLIMMLFLILERKRNPIENAQLDEQATRSFKDGILALGIICGSIAFGLIVAFALLSIRG